MYADFILISVAWNSGSRTSLAGRGGGGQCSAHYSANTAAPTPRPAMYEVKSSLIRNV